MSKKTKIFSIIIFTLIIVTGVLGYKLTNVNSKIDIYKQDAVYRIKDTVIFLLNNTDIDKNSEEILMSKLERDLSYLRPEVNIKKNTKEEVDEVTRLWWRAINTDYKNVKEEKKKIFLDTYEEVFVHISHFYDEKVNVVNRNGLSCNLKEFLTDVGNLGDW
ncbi:MAG: hypothetical protein ACRC41_10195 [Sarcina sp.]